MDPCCGTGNFLLQLPKQIRLEQIYGNDLDATSILLTRTNMVLKFGVSSLPMIYEHFTISDYFKWEQEKQYTANLLITMKNISYVEESMTVDI